MGQHLPTLNWEKDKTGKYKAGGRWRYWHKELRKNKYYSGGNGKSDRDNYRKQQEECAKWLKELEEAKPNRQAYEYAIGERQAILDYMTVSGDVDTALKERLTEELKTLRKNYQLPSPPPLIVNLNKEPPSPIRPDVLEGMDEIEHRRWKKKIGQLKAHQRWTAPASKRDTISHHAEQWLKTLERSAKLPGGITPSSFKTYEERTTVFKDWAGDRSVQELEGQLLLQFKAHLEDQVISEKITSRWAYNVMTLAKRFTKAMYTQGTLEHMPRCFDDALISPDNPGVVVWDKDEVKMFLSKASERTQLYILLCLNCGMYPSDISDLRQDEVDWKAGRITRKRTKTKKRKTVPEVTYLLWDSTFTLLKKFRSDNPTFALTNANGSQLVRREFTKKKDGTEKVGYVNNIAKAYERTCKKIKWKPAKSLMLLRKTGSDTLKNHHQYTNYRQYYLGQAGLTLADRRYTASGYDDFDESQIWLGEQFNQKTQR